MNSTTTAAQHDKNQHEPASKRELTIERVMKAPARLLFLAYSKPEHIKMWFGPQPYPVTFCEMDFRTGGAWSMQMTGPEGVAGPKFGGRYLEIIPNEKIVYDNGFLADDGSPPPPAQTMIVTITFADLGGDKTRLTIHTLFGSIAMHDEHTGMGYNTGVSLGLDQLDAFVTSTLSKAGV